MRRSGTFRPPAAVRVAAIAAAMLAWLALAPRAAQARGLVTGANGQHLWVARQDAKASAFTLYHRGSKDPPANLGRVQRLTGRLVAGGIAAVGDSAYLAYRGGAVQRVDARRSEADGTWRYTVTVRPFVPGAARVVAWAAGNAGPIALVHVTNADTLSRIDQGPKPLSPQERDQLDLVLGLPPGVNPDAAPAPAKSKNNKKGKGAGESKGKSKGESKSESKSKGNNESKSKGKGQSHPQAKAKPQSPSAAKSPPSAPAKAKTKTKSKTKTKAKAKAKAKPQSPSTELNASADAQAEEDVSADRLLVMSRGRWTPRPLPESWPTGKPAWMVLPRPEASDPVLLVRPGGGAGQTLRMYRWEKDHWARSTVKLPTPGALAAAGVAGRVVIAQHDAAGPGITLRCLVGNAGQARPLGKLTLPGDPRRPWALVSRGDRATAIAARKVTPPKPRGKKGSGKPGGGLFPVSEPSAPPPLAVTARSIDLKGKVSQPRTLSAKSVSPLDRPAGDYLVLAAILVMGVMMVFVLWKRDPSQAAVTVPQGLRPAELGRRALAGVIDVAPAVIAAMVIFQIGPRELLLRWPLQGVARSWAAMAPGGLAIGLVVAHTLAAEWVCQRSLGKRVTGLWVAGPEGGRPKAWQVIVRNALKAFDLVAWPLLILPLLSHHRQRLGDLIARTVVLQEEESQKAEGGSRK